MAELKVKRRMVGSIKAEASAGHRHLPLQSRMIRPEQHCHDPWHLIEVPNDLNTTIDSLAVRSGTFDFEYLGMEILDSEDDSLEYLGPRRAPLFRI